MPADERSLSEGKTIAGKLLPANFKDPVSIGGENTRTDMPGSQKSSDPMQVREFSDKFRVERLIGQGGMGEVYLAFDLKLNRPVAIKAILGQSVNSEAALQRFMTEAQAIAKIIHSHIVNIYELGQDKIGPYLVLEYVSGGSLADKLKSGPLSLERSIEITCQLCDGLAKVHAAGIIHRDIKPANILLTPEGDPKLTDFGLARHEFTDTGLTTTGAMIGTLGFMSPEQTNSSQVDARSDIYSLGATLYQMVTAKNPRVMNFNHVPNAIRDVLHKATEEIVEDRFQSVIDFRDALRGHRVVISVYDFNEGECPSCSTKNDPTRKFCKKCANSLLALCLSCSESIRVWEEVCDHCGKKQSLFIAKLKEKMLATQLEAEDLLSNYDFDKVLSLATQLKDQSDPRLRQFKPWADQFLTKIEADRMKAYEFVSSLISEALGYEKSYDYKAALEVLEKVHSNLRSLVISDLNVSANKILMRVQAEIRYLNERRSKMEKVNIEVESLIKEFGFDYAIHIVKPFANDSDPRLTDLKKQSQSLVDKVELHRVEAYQRVSSLMTEVFACEKVYDYESAMRLLETVPQKLRSMVALGSNVTVEEIKRRIEKQIDNYTAKRNKIQADLKRVEQLLEDLEFEAALNLLKPIVNENDPRLMDLNMASERLIDKVEAKRDETYRYVSSILSKAIAYERNYDYESAFQILDCYYETAADLGERDTPIRNLKIQGYSESINATYNRIKPLAIKVYGLDKSIRKLICEGDLERTLFAIDELLALQPNRKDMIDLKSCKLMSVRDESYEISKRLFFEQDYDSCLEQLNRIDVTVRNREIDELHEKACRNKKRLSTLYKEINEMIKVKDIDGLLVEVNELIALKSDDTSIIKLRDQLIERDSKDGEKSEMLLQEAISLRDECRFAEAVSALSQIAPRMKSGAIEEMIVEYKRFAELRKEAILKMEKPVGLENRRYAIGYGEQYLNLLNTNRCRLKDLEFQKRLDSLKNPYKMWVLEFSDTCSLVLWTVFYLVLVFYGVGVVWILISSIYAFFTEPKAFKFFLEYLF